jgi:hypothetical protein
MEPREYGAVAFFSPQAGVKLALRPRVSMAHDTGLPAGPFPEPQNGQTSGVTSVPSSQVSTARTLPSCR